MATGDGAAAAGLAVFSATQDHALGYENDNVRGDELADHMVNGGHPWSKISGKPATMPASTGSVDTSELVDGAVTNAKIADDAVTGAKVALNTLGQGHIADNSIGQGELQSDAVNTRHIETGAVTPTKLGPAVVLDEADKVTSNAYGRTVSGGGYYSMWMDSGHRIGRNTSSVRYKSDVEPHEVDPAAVLALQPVTYRRKGDPSGDYEYGLIAEDVLDAGLGELVVYYGGKVDGLRYDLLGVALLAVVQDQEARIAALEEALASAQAPEAETNDETTGEGA